MNTNMNMTGKNILTLTLTNMYMNTSMSTNILTPMKKGPLFTHILMKGNTGLMNTFTLPMKMKNMSIATKNFLTAVNC